MPSAMSWRRALIQLGKHVGPRSLTKPLPLELPLENSRVHAKGRTQKAGVPFLSCFHIFLVNGNLALYQPGSKIARIMPGCPMEPKPVRRDSRDFAVRGSS